MHIYECDGCGDFTTGCGEPRDCLRCGGHPRVQWLLTGWWLACAWVLRGRAWLARVVAP